MKMQWTKDRWIVPGSSGLIAGSGDRITHKIQCGETVQKIAAAAAERGAEPLSLESLAAELSVVFPPAVVRETLQVLLRLGLLSEAPGEDGQNLGSRHHPLYSYYERSVGSAVAAQKLGRLDSARVIVVGIGDLSAKVAAALVANGVHRIEPLDPSSIEDASFAGADLLIAAVEDDLERHRIFPLVNRSALRSKTPWLAVALRGTVAKVGPLFIPEETACYRCYELREEANLPNLADFRLVKEIAGRIKTGGAKAIPEFTLQAVAQMAAGEAVRILTREQMPATYQALLEIDMKNFESERHGLLKVPLCDACGAHAKFPFRRFWS